MNDMGRLLSVIVKHASCIVGLKCKQTPILIYVKLYGSFINIRTLLSSERMFLVLVRVIILDLKAFEFPI